MKPLYSIAILAHNHLELTKKCVESIFASEDADRCQVIVIDNASSDGTVDWLAECPFPIDTILHSTNTGIQAYNLAVGAAKGVYLVCLNNDVVVCGDWLSRMRQKFLEDPKMAIVGIREGPCYLNFAGVGDGTIQDGVPDYIEGAIMMVRTDLVRKHGLYDPAYRFCYCEDSDLSLRLRKLGYHIAHVLMNGVKHVHDASMSRQPRDIEGCHAINHVTLRRRWGTYLKTRSFSEKILIRRTMAMGDVLLVTPVIHALKRENSEAEIHVLTQYPEIFSNNPDVASAENYYPTETYNTHRVIDLDGCYERTPNRHIVDSYAEAAGVKVTDYFPRIYPRPEDYAEVDKMREHGERFGYSKWAVVHQGPKWGDGRQVEGRTLTDDLFLGAIGSYLKEKGYGVFEITDSRTPLLLLAAIIGKSELFVGADSGPMHLAQAMMTPTVGIFGAVNPFYRLVPGVPFLHGVSAWPEDCGCLGCHHLYEPPMLTSQCIRTGENFNRCMKKVRFEDVAKAIDFVLEQKQMYLETSKIRALVLPHLVGKGIDIGCQRDPITPDCVAFDKTPTPETTHTGDARKLPFADAEFDWVWCAKAGQRVLTPYGWRGIEHIRRGDVIVGRTGWVTVNEAFSLPCSSPLVSFETPQGNPIVTGNHPVATPLNWLHAEELREAAEVICCPSEIKPSKFVNRSDVLRIVRGLSSLGTFETTGVPVGDTPLAKLYCNLRLPFLPNQVRQKALKKIRLFLKGAMNRKALPAFRPWRSGFLSFVEATGYAFSPNQAQCMIHNSLIRVADLNHEVDGGISSNRKANASFPINEASEPSPVCFRRVHRVRLHHGVDRVYNLETSDGTFFLEGVLTHNSSHCLEDIPDTEAALVEWLRVLRPSGVIALYVPHPELYHGGNADHVHPGWRPEELAEYLTKLGCSIIAAITHDLPGPTHPCHSSVVLARKP